MQKKLCLYKSKIQIHYHRSYKYIFSLQEDPKFTRKVVQAVDRVGRILLRSNRINQFRCDFQGFKLISWCKTLFPFVHYFYFLNCSKHLIATITEWFHLLTDAYENEKTIRSKLGSLNDQIYLKVLFSAFIFFIEQKNGHINVCIFQDNNYFFSFVKIHKSRWNWSIDLLNWAWTLAWQIASKWSY